MTRASGETTRRVFLVGFPRSGTTLLQSLLASHPDVVSAPETWFFIRLVGMRHAYRCILPTRRAPRGRLEGLARQDKRLAPFPRVRALPNALSGFLSRAFVGALDELVAAEGAKIWIEKTPIHLHRISLIEKHVPNCRFVHILREGLPAIASLYSVADEYPEEWGQRSVEVCVHRWQNDVRLSLGNTGNFRHVFVSYERLVSETAIVLERLGRWLGIATDARTVEQMIGRYGAASRSVIADEPWKERVSEPIQNRNNDRVDRLWAPREQGDIKKRIALESDALSSLPYI